MTPAAGSCTVPGHITKESDEEHRPVGAPDISTLALPYDFVAEVATETPLAESVAKLVSVTSQIGRARDVLCDAGHTTSITGNRITVDDMVVAHYIGAENPRWVVWSIAGSPPTWVIGVAVS